MVVRCEAISIASSYVRKIRPESLLQSGQTQQPNSIKVTTCTRHEEEEAGGPAVCEEVGERGRERWREGERERQDERELGNWRRRRHRL